MARKPKRISKFADTLFVALRRLAKERLGGITKLALAMGYRDKRHLSQRNNTLYTGAADIERACERLEITPKELFLEHVFPVEVATGAELDPVAEFLAGAPPLPEAWHEYFELAWEGYDDPITPAAQAQLDEIERLRTENPAAAVSCTLPLIQSASQNVSLAAASLLMAALRLDLRLNEAVAVFDVTLKIARHFGKGKAEAALLLQGSFLLSNFGEYRAALHCAGAATLRYLDLGDQAGATTAQAARAVFMLATRRPAHALEICRSSFDRAGSRLLKAHIRGNMAHAALALRKMKLARQYAADAEELLDSVPSKNPRDVLILTWLKARLTERKCVERAEHLYGLVEQCITANRLPRAHIVEAAMALLDYSRFLARRKRFFEASKVARLTAKIATPVASRSPVIAAVVAQLVAAAERNAVTLRLLAVVRRAFRGAREGQALYALTCPPREV